MATLPLHALEAWAEELVIGPRHPRRDVVSDIRRRCLLMVSTHRRAAAAYNLPEDWPFCAMAPQRAPR
ncbi:hypothetical protein [Muricoccus vinaceus]|uniref:Uncharacterized protein n=1 Tax=Muricoccus vinaceus TaxID=424704 RepID=A0ABV6IL94_9PROT